jgi:hypothetical protein
MGPLAAAGVAQGVGGLVKGLFGKTKTKLKRKPKTAAIGAALAADQKALEGDMSQLRSAGDAAYGDISGKMAGLSDAYDRGVQTLDQYTPEGRQYRRYEAGIDRLGADLRAANQDATDAVSRRFNQQQALMGGGGGMSPFMQMAQANQLGAMNRGVAANIGGMRLDNMRRFQDYGYNNPAQRFALFNTYAGSRQLPMQVLGNRNQLTNQRMMGSLNAENAGTNTIVQKKDNWANKLGGALQSAGGAVGNIAASSAMLNSLGQSAPTWSSMFGGGGGGSRVNPSTGRLSWLPSRNVSTDQVGASGMPSWALNG